MKKILCLFSAIALVLTSCTGEDSPAPVVPTPILVTKIIRESNSNIFTREFTYDGAKLNTESSSDGLVKYYTYENDLITFIETKEGTTTRREMFVEYNSNNKIIRTIDLDYNATNPNIAGFKAEYTYNPDGTVFVIHHYGTITEQNTFNYKSLLYFDSLKQIIKLEDMNVNDEIIYSLTINYDGYNSPFKNVLGYHKFIFNLYDGVQNVSDVQDALWTSGGAYWSLNIYSYNSSNYPITRSFSSRDVTQEDYEYFYNQ